MPKKCLHIFNRRHDSTLMTILKYGFVVKIHAEQKISNQQNTKHANNFEFHVHGLTSHLKKKKDVACPSSI